MLRGVNRVGPVVLLAGVLAVVAGAEPLGAARGVLVRVAPVLGFLLAVAVVADLARDACLFDVVADRAARAARGSVPALFAALVVVCVAATWLLSLDTTAVLLTPVALTLAARYRLDPRPFALATLWLANTGSLLLPVANLTNLLALDRLGVTTMQYLRLTAAPQVAVLVVTVGVLVARNRAALRGRYACPPPVDAPRGPVVAAAVAALGIGVGVVAGVAPWVAALAALALLVGVLVRHDAALVRPARLLRLAPWPMAAFALGLFLLVDVVTAHLPVAALVVPGEGPAARMSVAALGAALANGVDNLPAYLALEPHVHGHRAVAALLVGVNAGPLLTPWGSLATLLWLRACSTQGVSLGPRDVLREGLVLVPLVVIAGALAC